MCRRWTLMRWWRGRWRDSWGVLGGRAGRTAGAGAAGRAGLVRRQRLEGDVRAGRDARTGLDARGGARTRSEEHTSELQSLMRSSYAVFCLKKKKDTCTLHN